MAPTLVLSTRSPPSVSVWLHWILLGLLAGTLGKFLLPGRDPPGCIITVTLGILGAVIGGWIGVLLGWGRISQPAFDARSIAMATAGAILVLVAGRVAMGAVKRRRARAQEPEATERPGEQP